MTGRLLWFQDEESGIVMLKRHLRQQRSIDDYGKNIKQLAGRAQKLLSAGHPEGCVCVSHIVQARKTVEGNKKKAKIALWGLMGLE